MYQHYTYAANMGKISVKLKKAKEIRKIGIHAKENVSGKKSYNPALEKNIDH